ncbi:MAG: peptidyl-prolyl cis-trans isomerase, partial [Sphaerochaetaceae bacterium]|nr:peptidyl-prolyl cis-trans isomerase [Sphaerochaetaceae bacterium]
MKKILLTVFVCVLVVVPAFCGGAKETKTENVITDISQEEKTSSSIVKEGTPIVRVNLTKNDVVTQQDLDEAYDYYKEIYGKELTSEDVLDALIDDIIFKQGAERDGYSLNEDQKNNLFATQKKTMEEQAGQKISDEDFDKYLQNNTGMSVEDYKEYLASQYILQSYVMGVKKEQIENVEIPTEDQIKKLYEENVDQFVTPDYVKISHIFFQFGDNKTADYSKAVNVLNQIKNGSITFEKAAQSYSEDESTKGDSGLIDGWIEAENSYYSQMFGEKAVEEIFKLNPGEYSDV